jgi:hypothetical protein
MSSIHLYYDYTLFEKSLRYSVQTGSRPTQPPIRWISGAKLPEREADHSSPSTAEVKNVWSYTTTPQYVFMVWCLIKQWIQGQLYLTFAFALVFM